VHAVLSQRIADGTLPTGTRLNIGKIADEFNVGRDTVQRAITMLADDGLVQRWPGLGWYVTTKDESSAQPS
jgi:DNA-binding GntR family transcriptional regulator